jgi:hypothetical protein
MTPCSMARISHAFFALGTPENGNSGALRAALTNK